MLQNFWRSITTIKRIGAAMCLVDEMKAIAFHPEVTSTLPEIGKRLKKRLDYGLSVRRPIVEEGQEMLQHLKEIYEPTGPTPEAEPLPTSSLLKLLPLFAKDATKGHVTTSYLKNTNLASYGPKQHVIIVNMHGGETIRFLALVCLHELHHAELAELEGRTLLPQTRTFHSRLLEEVMLWTEDAKLMYMIAGEQYRRAAKQRVQLIKDCLVRKVLVPPPYRESEMLCDQFFGPALSPKARAGRRHSFDMYCRFLALEEYYEGKPDLVQVHKVQLFRPHMTPE